MAKPNRSHNTPGSRANAPETSLEAGESVSDAAASRRALALAFIRSQGRTGATADEVADRYDWERYSSRPRLSELKAAKAIVATAERRKGASGRSQCVWIVAELGPSNDDGQLSLLDAA